MSWLKHEIQVFFTALMFYTRLPCPAWVTHEAEYLNKATRYFPLIGWLVGGAAALTYWGAGQILSPAVGVVLSFVVSVLLTGAFHEDGFADVCDAFGGGWTKEKILEIMKDSRMGAYGLVGTLLLFLLKFTLLLELDPYLAPLVIFGAAAYSRFCAATFIYTHRYVRENEDSKAKPVAKSLNQVNLLVAGLFGLVVQVLFESWYIGLVLLATYGLKVYLGRYFSKWIGGYTGDCLGATQQVCETGYYLFFVLVWRFI
jgi:adenosylcobinamide-GDP ribazoletransferase